MTYHIRVPLKGIAVFKITILETSTILQSRKLKELFEEGKFILTCEEIFPDDRTIVQVCDDCGAELTNDEEHELGVCEECYKKDQQRKCNECQHPDQK